MTKYASFAHLSIFRVAAILPFVFESFAYSAEPPKSSAILYSLDDDTQEAASIKQKPASKLSKTPSADNDIDWDNIEIDAVPMLFNQDNGSKYTESPQKTSPGPTKAQTTITPKSPAQSKPIADGPVLPPAATTIINPPTTPVAAPAPVSAPAAANTAQSAPQQVNTESQPILINFNNVSIIEFIRFVSRISNKNFIFNEGDLQFNVTIISDEPTSVENIMMALMQELRIHQLFMIEEEDNIIIHPMINVKAPGTVFGNKLPTDAKNADIITQVFRLNTANASNVLNILRPVLSDNAIVDSLEDNNNIIITDISSNVHKVAEIIRNVDAPMSGNYIGQYVVKNAYLDILVQNAQLILNSIAQGQTIVLVPHTPSNSIFIIASPFIVERAIPILQRLDRNDATTSIFSLDDLKYMEESQFGKDAQGKGIFGEGRKGNWKLDENGNWYYDPSGSEDVFKNHGAAPKGSWKVDSQGNWEFAPNATPQEGERQPNGKWVLGSDGKWHFVLDSDESIYAGKKINASSINSNLPIGHIERTKFYIYKLQYRKGDEITEAMIHIAESLRETQSVNGDLIAAVNSVQWLEASNSLVFTGTPDALLKVKELIEEMDMPLRQVFIEMLILQTTVDDSLRYGVNMGTRFGGGDGLAGAQGFVSGALPLLSLLKTGGIAKAATLTAAAVASTPDGTNVLDTGYNMGIIGQRLRCGNTEFSSVGGLVRAIHEKTCANIIMNPKILAEDGVTAELFVGINTQFKTQSVANNLGSILTNNFEFRDVGTTLKVTPILGPTNIITLIIEQEVSNVLQTTTASGSLISDAGNGPTTSIHKTKTRIHVPDGYFLVMSGMIDDERTRVRKNVPCLGGAPIIGAAVSDKDDKAQKRNLMVFIRPQLIDTEEQIQTLTRHQQEVFRLKKRSKPMWKLESEEALDWLNLKKLDPNTTDGGCCDDDI